MASSSKENDDSTSIKIVHHEKGNCCVVLWHIDHFSTYLEADDFITSPKFFVSGRSWMKWRLRLYFRGEDNNYIGIGLLPMTEIRELTAITCNITIVENSGEINAKPCYMNVTRLVGNVAFPQLLRIVLFTREDAQILKGDTLLIKCELNMESHEFKPICFPSARHYRKIQEEDGLCKMMKNLTLEPIHSDFSWVTHRETVNVHKAVLATRSILFRNLFVRVVTSQTQLSVFDMDDNIISALLVYTYTGNPYDIGCIPFGLEEAAKKCRFSLLKYFSEPHTISLRTKKKVQKMEILLKIKNLKKPPHKRELISYEFEMGDYDHSKWLLLVDLRTPSVLKFKLSKLSCPPKTFSINIHIFAQNLRNNYEFLASKSLSSTHTKPETYDFKAWTTFLQNPFFTPKKHLTLKIIIQLSYSPVADINEVFKMKFSSEIRRAEKTLAPDFEKLKADVFKMYESKKFNDLLLISETGSINIHKFIAALHSSFFRNILSEKKDLKYFSMLDVKQSTLEAIGRFMYSFEIPNFDLNNAIVLLAAAKTYELIYMQALIICMLESILNETSANGIFQIASKFNLEELEMKAKNVLISIGVEVEEESSEKSTSHIPFPVSSVQPENPMQSDLEGMAYRMYERVSLEMDSQGSKKRHQMRMCQQNPVRDPRLGYDFHRSETFREKTSCNEKIKEFHSSHVVQTEKKKCSQESTSHINLPVSTIQLESSEKSNVAGMELMDPKFSQLGRQEQYSDIVKQSGIDYQDPMSSQPNMSYKYPIPSPKPRFDRRLPKSLKKSNKENLKKCEASMERKLSPEIIKTNIKSDDSIKSFQSSRNFQDEIESSDSKKCQDKDINYLACMDDQTRTGSHTIENEDTRSLIPDMAHGASVARPDFIMNIQEHVTSSQQDTNHQNFKMSLRLPLNNQGPVQISRPYIDEDPVRNFKLSVDDQEPVRCPRPNIDDLGPARSAGTTVDDQDYQRSCHGVIGDPPPLKSLQHSVSQRECVISHFSSREHYLRSPQKRRDYKKFSKTLRTDKDYEGSVRLKTDKNIKDSLTSPLRSMDLASPLTSPQLGKDREHSISCVLKDKDHLTSTQLSTQFDDPVTGVKLSMDLEDPVARLRFSIDLDDSETNLRRRLDQELISSLPPNQVKEEPVTIIKPCMDHVDPLTIPQPMGDETFLTSTDLYVDHCNFIASPPSPKDYQNPIKIPETSYKDPVRSPRQSMSQVLVRSPGGSKINFNLVRSPSRSLNKYDPLRSPGRSKNHPPAPRSRKRSTGQKDAINLQTITEYQYPTLPYYGMDQPNLTDTQSNIHHEVSMGRNQPYMCGQDLESFPPGTDNRPPLRLGMKNIDLTSLELCMENTGPLLGLEPFLKSPRFVASHESDVKNIGHIENIEPEIKTVVPVASVEPSARNVDHATNINLCTKLVDVTNTDPNVECMDLVIGSTPRAERFHPAGTSVSNIEPVASSVLDKNEERSASCTENAELIEISEPVIEN